MKRSTALAQIFILLALILCRPLAAETLRPNGGWSPAWSPDGTTIAFLSGSPHGIPNLWLTRSDGNGMSKMTTRGAHAPIWKADGHQVIFGSNRSGIGEYIAVDAKGSPNNETKLPYLPTGAESLLFSRNGNLAAYALVTEDGKARDLWYARPDGTKSKLTSMFWVRESAWSPDGTQVSFVVGRSTGSSIWTINLADKDLRLLYRGYTSAPAYSPDGTKLAISTTDKLSEFAIVVVDLKTHKEQRIAVKTFGGRQLIWSPDGSRLYFASGPRFEPSIWSVGSDGKDLTRLTPEGLASESPALSPDGRKIAFQGVTKKSFSPDLYVCDTSSKKLKRMTYSRESYWAPVWSPDSKRLAFRSDRNHAIELLVSTESGGHMGSRIELMDTPATSVSWFPDNSRLLVSDGGFMSLVNASGKKGLVSGFKSVFRKSQSPSLKGNTIYFTEWQGRNAGISAVNIDDKGLRQLTNKPAPKPAVKPATTEKTPSLGAGEHKVASRGVLVASTNFFIPQTVVAQALPPSEIQSGAGDPHAGLGLMGPIPDVSSGDDKSVADLHPAVSPDGKQVAFIRSGQVWIVGADGTGEKQISKFTNESAKKRIVSSVSWSPSGDQLLSQAIASEVGKIRLELWLSKPGGESDKLIYSEYAASEYGIFYSECTFPAFFTPDGKGVIFTSVSGEDPGIVSLKLNGDKLDKLVTGPASYAALDASGKKLAYVDLTDSVERIRVLDLASGDRSGRALFGD